MELKILIKQSTQFNIYGQVIHYAGGTPQTLNATPGALPQPRQWSNYGTFIDATNDVSDITKLKLTWTEDRDINGDTTPGAFQSKKSTSGVLTFENEVYRNIKAWLIDDISAPLNGVDVKIQHVGCGYYENYVIRPADLSWCEDGNQTCTFDVTLKQKDDALICIKRTLITQKDEKDNRDWFPANSSVPSGGKQHPRFSYCNEIRPNGLLVLAWWNGAIVWTVTAAILFAIYGIINSIIVTVIYPIIAIINGIVSFLNALGASLDFLDYPKLFDPDDIVKDYQQKFIESGGCGREHPAPLIRDYIWNVCKICGLDVDALPVTAPIFFNTSLTVETSSRGLITQSNPYYNACYMNAPIKRGIRRFENITIFGATPINSTDFWIPENANNTFLDLFLDELKGVFNAEWRVKNNKLYFQRKDFFLDGNPILDLTETSADRLKLLEGICFDWNEIKYPAILRGIYDYDAADTCGNEALQPMNGVKGADAVLSFGKTDNNPNFEGVLDKTVKFGATKFRLDGASTDYLFDAMQVVVNGSALTAGFIVPAFKFFIVPAIARYADYALLLKDETFALPKILVWNGVDYINAKAVQPHTAYPIGLPNPPAINYKYGTMPWYDKHPPQTFVIGSSLTLGNSPKGYYKVQDYFGIQITKQPAMLCNYPMYFEPDYVNSLWDLFHWIDDPRKNPRMMLNWQARLELCCENLELLGVLGDGSNVKLSERVKLPIKYYQDGRIKEIEVSYDTSDEMGQHILIKGEA